MDPSLIAILAVGVSLAALIVGGQRALRADFRTEIGGLRTEIGSLGDRVTKVEDAIHAIDTRVARIEGRLSGPPRGFVGIRAILPIRRNGPRPTTARPTAILTA